MKQTKTTYRPRGDKVIIQITYQTKLATGLHVGQGSAEGKVLTVVGMGPEVEDLKVGDRVLAIGQMGEDFFALPGRADLLIMRQNNIMVVLEEQLTDEVELTTPPLEELGDK